MTKKPTAQEFQQAHDDMVQSGEIVWNGKFRAGPSGEMQPVYVAAEFAPDRDHHTTGLKTKRATKKAAR
jgi:hypothetical protein